MASKMVFDYKLNTPFEIRRMEGEMIRKKYPERVPVRIQKAPNATVGDPGRLHRCCAPKDLPVFQFMSLLRRNIKDLRPETAIFLFINNKTMVPMSKTMGEVFDEYHEEDFQLYITYCEENVFGQ